MSFEYPDFVARFYDLIYDHIRTGVDNQFYLDQISASKGPVLESGVGTGRFFIDARKAGADMYGIDISPSMIDMLRKKIPPSEHSRVWVQDLAHLDTSMRFGLIIAPFRMFSHLVEVDDQRKALVSVHKHLLPGGRFIFDVYVPDFKMLHEGIHGSVDFEKDYAPGKHFHRTVDMKANAVTQISSVTMTFSWEEPDGRPREETWSFPMRFFFRYELEHLVARSPLKMETILGDFRGTSLNESSREFIVICSRQPGI
jgi:SAM-dependent methyltransferase